MTKFKTILVDPPTAYQTYSGPRVPSRAKEQPYKTISWEKLETLPVGKLADKDCILFLWGTWPHLKNTIKLGEAWGFTYKTLGFNWAKRTKNWKWAVGGGYWTRANSEYCLIFSRGHPHRIDKGVRSLVEARVSKVHSAKPIEVQEGIERLVAGPYLEIFGRNLRENWTVLGNEIDGKDIFEAIEELLQK